ncbi:hypothetical protein TNCV_775731 [Trichonephila clavipes]|nr:hypothetical protein TNCV_775731 [Trichonephila clavipes]
MGRGAGALFSSDNVRLPITIIIASPQQKPAYYVPIMRTVSNGRSLHLSGGTLVLPFQASRSDSNVSNPMGLD